MNDKYWLCYRETHPKPFRIRVMRVVTILLIVALMTTPTIKPEVKAEIPLPEIEASEPPSTQIAEPPAVYYSADIPKEDSTEEKIVKTLGTEGLKVAKCESGLDPKAVNRRTEDYGLLQINYKTWGDYFGVTREELLDEDTNLRLAKVIYDQSGWQPWSSSKRCHQLS